MEVTLRAEQRIGTGKGVARKLRAAGKIPATLYGRGLEAVSLTVERRAITSALQTEAGANVLIDLEVDGVTHLTLARELQRDAVRGTLLHVDFLKISRDVAIQVDVPVHIVGESPGVKEGGVIEHHLWQVKVECLPANVPERMDAVVSELRIGDHLRVGELRPPEGVTILTDPEETVLSVVVPQVLVVEEVAPAEAVEGEVPVAAEGEAAEGEAPPAEGEES